MTRQEAIKILKAAETDKFPYEPELLVEAMDMAISSLETDESYQLEYEYEKSKALFGKMVQEEDCISKEKVLGILVTNWQSQEGDDAMQSSINEITVLPSVYPKSDKPSGKWLHKQIDSFYHVIGQCSICKQRYRINNYCPNCGAKMVEEQTGENT